MSAIKFYEEKEDSSSIVESLGKPIERNFLGSELVDSVFFCNHEKKYINEAGGVKFWVCPVCKLDHGDA